MYIGGGAVLLIIILVVLFLRWVRERSVL